MAHASGCAAIDAADAEPAERVRWLEAALAGLDVPKAIAQIAAISGLPAEIAEEPMESVRAWLGTDTAAVLASGLRCLPKGKLDEFFCRPGLLAGLQELVLTEGGMHWDRLVHADRAVDALAARHESRICDALGLTNEGGRNHPSGTAQSWLESSCRRSPTPEQGSRIRLPAASWRHLALWAVPLAVAATVLLAIGPAWRTSPAPSTDAGADSVVATNSQSALPGAPAERAVASDAADWPAHPLEEIGKGDFVFTADQRLGPLAVKSREWAHQFRDATDLSASQVRAAAGRVKGAFVLLEQFAQENTAGLDSETQSRIRAKCQSAKAALSRVQDAIAADDDQEKIERAKRDILKAVVEFEEIVGK